MQKVEGSSPFIRSPGKPRTRGFFSWLVPPARCPLNRPARDWLGLIERGDLRVAMYAEDVRRGSCREHSRLGGLRPPDVVMAVCLDRRRNVSSDSINAMRLRALNSDELVDLVGADKFMAYAHPHHEAKYGEGPEFVERARWRVFRVRQMLAGPPRTCSRVTGISRSRPRGRRPRVTRRARSRSPGREPEPDPLVQRGRR